MPEPDGTFATAEFLFVGVPWRDDVGFPGPGYIDTADYFWFALASIDGTVAVSLTGLTANIDVSAYNSSQSLIGSSANGGSSDEFFSFNEVALQAYYIKVYPSLSDASTYTLSTNLAPAQTVPI